MEFPIIDVKATGERMKALCREEGLSASKIKGQLSLSCVQTVYKWFSGQNIPSIENFYALSLMLGVTMEEMLVTKNKPDHSRFWQKHIYVMPELNLHFAERMNAYRMQAM